MSKKGPTGDFFFHFGIFSIFQKMDNIFLPKKKDFCLPTGHTYGHMLDRKQIFVC